MDIPGNSRITTKTVALIGHSAAGKSSCLASSDADMDVALGTHEPPSLDKMLNWLTAPSRPAIVAVSIFEERLKALCSAKLSGKYPEKFGTIHFVYLCKSKECLKRDLSKPTASGFIRPLVDQEYTLTTYDRFHSLFNDLADEVIDCSTASEVEVALRVCEVSEQANKIGETKVPEVVVSRDSFKRS